jgi:hypothetical protein
MEVSCHSSDFRCSQEKNSCIGQEVYYEASVVKMFSCDDISGMNDMRLISSPIQAPSHEFDEME